VSGFAVGDWIPSWAPEAYATAIDDVRAAIARGDVYQVNLVQHLDAPFDGDPGALASAFAPLRPIHPWPFVGEDWAIVSASQVWPNGDLELALTIRTFAVAGERIHLWLGGGIVWDSEADAEIEESWVKARPLLDALKTSVT
jgi:anthranilate/para-aminobenzoate synthase component I